MDEARRTSLAAQEGLARNTALDHCVTRGFHAVQGQDSANSRTSTRLRPKLAEKTRLCSIANKRLEAAATAIAALHHVRMAIEIDSLVPLAGGRKAIEGRYLTSGDEVYDAYVGKPTPVETTRNPITYFDSPSAPAPATAAAENGRPAAGS